MESQTVVTARLSSGTRITIDTGPHGSSFVDLVGAENVRVDLAGSPATSYVVIHAKHGPQGCTPIDLTDCTVALSLGHAMAIGEVAAAEMARLADHVQQEAREHRDAEHTIPASTMTLYARAHSGLGRPDGLPHRRAGVGRAGGPRPLRPCDPRRRLGLFRCRLANGLPA